MDPRLKTSLQWTALPNELRAQIKGIFAENFSQYLKGKSEFIVEGRIYKEELLLRVGVLQHGTIRQRNFEVSIDFNPLKENALKQIHLAIDCAASMMEEFFTSEAKDPWETFPKIWEPFEAGEKTAYLQVSAINSELESKADEILGETGDSFIHGEDIEEARKSVITMLGLGDEDDDSETKH